jgi:hypothetical protein
MPVDFTTLKLREYNCNRILNNFVLDFTSFANEDGVVIDNKRIAEHHFCKIIVYDTGTVQFKGSLHKMFNSIKDIYAPNYKKNEAYEGFNGNTFTFENLCFTIKYLESLFGISKNYFIIQKIEIGLNINIDFCPREIITNLIESGGKMFEMRYNENFAQVCKDDYYFKVYNKSNHYGMMQSVLRVEIKTRRMREFQSAGIKTLANLSIENLNKAILRLSERWKNVLLYDYTIVKENLSTKQKKELKNKFQFPKYWVNIKSNNKHKPRNRYLEIVNEHSKNIHKEIYLKIKMTNISQFN